MIPISSRDFDRTNSNFRFFIPSQTTFLQIIELLIQERGKKIFKKIKKKFIAFVDTKKKKSDSSIILPTCYHGNLYAYYPGNRIFTKRERNKKLWHLLTFWGHAIIQIMKKINQNGWTEKEKKKNTKADSKSFIKKIIPFFFFSLLGMGYRPNPPGVNVESTLIWYKGSNQENFQYWINALEEFLEGEEFCEKVFF